MSHKIAEIYRLILKHNWRVERVIRKPIYNHSTITMTYIIDLESPHGMVDTGFILDDGQ